MLINFTSKRREIIPLDDNPVAIVESLRGKIHTDNLPVKLDASQNGYFAGKIDGRNVEVRRVGRTRTVLDPTLHIHVEYAPDGGAVVCTHFTSPLPVRIFLSLCMPIAVWIALSLLAWRLATGADIPASNIVAVPACCLFLLQLIRLSTRAKEKQLQELVDELKQSYESTEELSTSA